MNWYKKAQQVLTLESIMEKWKERGVVLYLYEKNNVVVLSSIIVPKHMRKQGIGSQIMQEIIDYADKTGKRLELSPGQKDDYHGTTSHNRLINFYKRFGLIQNKGRNKDFTTTNTMYREPKKNELV